MKIAYFTHSLTSCWNHGNAHFLRGVLRALTRRGHEVTSYEPRTGWSRSNLLADHGASATEAFLAEYSDLNFEFHDGGAPPEAIADTDLVIVHEWNEPELVAAIGEQRKHGRFRLLFHDTHHRAVSDPRAIRAFELESYDGVLAFGEALADVYRRLGWGDRAFVWHEAADASLFRPPAKEGSRAGLVWIGNWGDGERSRELDELLIGPAQEAGLALDVYGVRYPSDALAALTRRGARYRGWLANVRVPDVFAQHLATAHIPRRYYSEALRGIPTIRVFEALACGIPLVCAPWEDAEGLFRPGRDYLVAHDAAEMVRHLRALRCDPALRMALAESGLATIRARHTCAHRAEELLSIVARLRAVEPADMPA